MRVYVTGGTGFVGSNIVKLYSDWHQLEVVCAGRRAPERELAGKFVAADLLDPESVRQSVGASEPDLLVHTAILNDFNEMYANRKLAWDVYVEATRTLVDAANEMGATFVYVSTDWVFDGTHPESDEDTPPNPINYYGVLKAAAELLVLERSNDPIVARVAGVNGMHWARPHSPRAQDPGFGHFVAALVDELSAGKPFTVWESELIGQRATPSLASESAEMMLRLAQRGARGIFHCCGGESTTRLELAQAAADAFGLDQSLLQIGAPDPSGLLSAPVPVDTSLDARKTAATIDYELPSVRALLEEFRRQRETGEIRPISAAAYDLKGRVQST